MIEMIVVITVLGVLLLVAIPALTGTVEKTEDQSVKSGLTDISRYISSRFSEDGKLATAQKLAQDFKDDNPGYTITNGQVFAVNSYRIQRNAPNSTTVRVGSPSGRFFAIRQIFSGSHAAVYRTTGTNRTNVVNIVPNPSLESGNSAPWWQSAAGSALSIHEGKGASGRHFLRATTDGSREWQGASLSDMPVSPNTTYSASIYLRLPQAHAGRAICFFHHTYNSSSPWNLLSNTTSCAVGSTEWQRLSTQFKSGAGADRARIGFFPYTSNTSAIAIEADAALLTIGSTLYPYFDGDYPGGSWSGTVGNSASEALPWERW